MNRTELCARIAARSSLSRAEAAAAVDAVVRAVANALERGDAVNIPGFGKIPARTVPVFKAGKALRDRLKG